jgi:hypothetical protein
VDETRGRRDDCGVLDQRGAVGGFGGALRDRPQLAGRTILPHPKRRVVGAGDGYFGFLVLAEAFTLLSSSIAGWTVSSLK